MGPFGRRFVGGILAVGIVLGAGSARAAEVMAVLIPNGFSTFLEDGSGLTNPLLCEGNVVCGFEEDTEIVEVERDDGGHEAFLTVKVCEERAVSSCITVRRAHFVDQPVPELVPAVSEIIRRDFSDVPTTILDGGMTFQSTMTEHDPIRCEDVTGRFAEPGCAGKLKLDYRCLNMIRIETLEFFTAKGSYIITRTD